MGRRAGSKRWAIWIGAPLPVAVLAGSVALTWTPIGGVRASGVRSAVQRLLASMTAATAEAGAGLRSWSRGHSSRTVAANVAGGETTASGPPTDQQLLSEASGGVTELSRLYGEDAHRRAAAVLEDLALLARRLDDSAATAQDSNRVLEEARALTSGNEWFKGADHAREGLDACLDALQHRSGEPPGELTPWLDSARASVESIRAGSSFDFERPAMQDAFRAVLDCYRLAVLLAK